MKPNQHLLLLDTNKTSPRLISPAHANPNTNFLHYNKFVHTTTISEPLLSTREAWFYENKEEEEGE